MSNSEKLIWKTEIEGTVFLFIFEFTIKNSVDSIITLLY